MMPSTRNSIKGGKETEMMMERENRRRKRNLMIKVNILKKRNL
jgi:hypothetical protein